MKIAALTGVWKKLIPTFMDDFEGFKTTVMKVTTDVVEIPREHELKAKCVFHGSLDGREIWGRMATCMCIAESLHYSPETHNFVRQLSPNTK